MTDINKLAYEIYLSYQNDKDPVFTEEGFYYWLDKTHYLKYYNLAIKKIRKNKISKINESNL